jgi:D-lactate dehydrogenase
LQQYQYAGLDTCSVDGLCQTDCPVQINTGELVKRLRRENHSTTANALATWVSRHFGKTEWVVRAALRGGMAVNKVLGPMAMTRLTNGLRIVSKSIPTWWPQMSHPPVWKPLQPAQPDVVYFSACLNRMMGSHTPHKPGVQQAFVEVCRRAGLQVLLPPNLAGHCCGQAFGSKGFSEAAKLAQEKTIDALLQWSNNGAIPVVCDFTSCTYNLISTAKNLATEYREKFDKLTVLDCLDWLHNQVIPKLDITAKKDNVVLHPVCA